MKNEFRSVLQVSREDAVQIIRLADEPTRNSLSDRMRVALPDALRQAAADPQVRVLYLTGTGRSFCIRDWIPT
ncbi:MAG: hypothetical protein A3G24_19145 [Betaproteobacteria bacterium RIFCSPLOWO2_12_FULL_62_13]|nr:MAG: hypothetical protein A3G24_19145 [Betaproteobacteria bacterium RIFCSPLOWO2_12_FULL_62_13]